MPPKNKKDAEEEAKRLEEEKRLRQQEEARLQEERKKYLSESLPTGLLLPASGQLIIDFFNKPLDFITDKLKIGTQEAYPALSNSPRFAFVMKELHYYIKDSLELFGRVQAQQKAIKHRIFIGIMLATLLNNDSNIDGVNKNQEEDEKFIKDLVIKHCQTTDGKRWLQKSEGLKILQYAAEKYFGHFQLIKFFDKFQKREISKSFELYLETPNTYTNDLETQFTDLSKKEEPNEPQKIA